MTDVPRLCECCGQLIPDGEQFSIEAGSPRRMIIVLHLDCLSLALRWAAKQAANHTQEGA